jgi:mitogen-activated protein kinase kinase kinase
MSSPEEGISPVVEGGSGFRARTGSFNTSAKRLLQVTTDNEQFTLVDITGMNTAEAIRDRIFSKVRYILRLVGSGAD